jgi:glycosyltransferase involved in cell wall biosynthesis
MKIAVLTPVPVSGEAGGAEVLYKFLIRSLRKYVRVDQIKVACDEKNMVSIKRNYLTFYDRDVSAYDGVVSTKVPSYIVYHPNHVCYLIHTMRSFYDMFEREFPKPSQIIRRERDFIINLDTAALSYPRVRKLFVIGDEVKNRLKKWNGLDSEVLRPGLPEGKFRSEDYRYFLLASRLHRWKRIDLAIKAFKRVKGDIKLVIVGRGEDESHFKKLAANDSRIHFSGWVSRKKLLKVYSNALAVLFVAKNEDYGFITSEAFASSKPVITCTDSGEPARIVKENVSGFICPPKQTCLAEKMDFFFKNKSAAAEMGERGKRDLNLLSWDKIATRLISELKIK